MSNIKDLQEVELQILKDVQKSASIIIFLIVLHMDRY